MSAIVFDGDQPRMTPAGPHFISVVMRTSEVEIIDTWDSLGMRGTDSNDIEARGVFVPESRAFRFEPDSVASAPFDGPLYRMPALSATYPIIVPVALAIASGAIRELRDIVTTKVSLGSMKTARDRVAVQSAVAEAEAMVRSARLFFYDALTRAWERAVAQQPFALENKHARQHVGGAQRGSLNRSHAPHGRYERNLCAEPARAALPRRADGATPRLRFGQSPGNRWAGLSRGRTGVSVRGLLRLAAS